jgi:hypothetical protein
MNLITPMAQQVMATLEVARIAVTADKGYASVTDIAAAVQTGVEPHIAGTDNDICIPATDGEHSPITAHHNGRCVYIAERNSALCPMGKVLYPGFYKASKGEAVLYNTEACKHCTCRCTTGERGFRYQVKMAQADFTLAYNDQDLVVRQVRIKPQSAIYAQRKSIVEHPFGTMKRAMDGSYCLLRGKTKVSGEFSLLLLAYNIKRAINILGSASLRTMMMAYTPCQAL